MVFTLLDDSNGYYISNLLINIPEYCQLQAVSNEFFSSVLWIKIPADIINIRCDKGVFGSSPVGLFSPES
jgi:hypothetical protein